MRKETEGLILTEMSVGDKDRLVTVLTRDSGVLRCFVRGAKNQRSRTFYATQTLCYSRLSIFQRKDSYVIDEAEVIRMFYDVRKDIEQLALAQYFCELARFAVPENVDSSWQLSLVLNCLYYLPLGTKPLLQIKTAFEIRMMISLGYYPNILYCAGCGCYEADEMFFSPDENKLLCAGCKGGSTGMLPLSRGAIMSFRYIMVAEKKKFLSFKASQQTLEELSRCTEGFVMNTFHKSFSALDFYNQVRTK